MSLRTPAPRLTVRVTQMALAGAFALGALFTPFAGAAHAGEQVGTFNLTLDSDGNGLADELEFAVSAIETAEDKDAAIAEFIARLPYSEETRALQSKAEELNKQLETADEKTAPALLEQIKALDDEMAKDPAYAAVMEDLDTLLKPEELRGDPTTQWRTPWGRVQPGDVLLQFDYLSPPGYFYAMNYGHTGNYWGGGYVFESLAQGVVITELNTWQTGLKFNMIARNAYRSQGQVVGAMNYRQWLYMGDGRHTPYNYAWWDKWTDSRVYCAQLTWKIHGDTGVDLDSNHWAYHLFIGSRYGWWAVYFIARPAVAPDEIRLSNGIYPVGSGIN